jgi:hypothetical protein
MWIAGSLMVQDPHFNLLMADSGCEISVFSSDSYFVTREYRRTEILTAKTDYSIISEMRGVVEFPVRDTHGQLIMLTLSPCLLAPACDISLMSVATLIASGYHVNFTPQSSGILVDSSILIPFKRVRNLWFLQLVDTVSPTTIATKLNRPDPKTIIQWHLTFAHASDRVSYETAKISRCTRSTSVTTH